MRFRLLQPELLINPHETRLEVFGLTGLELSGINFEVIRHYLAHPALWLYNTCQPLLRCKDGNLDEGLPRLKECLTDMARGRDAWETFLELQGPFILHILKSDYGFYDEFDQHTRQEVLHDIYLRTAKYSGRIAGCDSEAAIRGYLRRIIRSIMSNKRRIARKIRREISLEDGVTEPVSTSTTGFNPLSWIEDSWWGRNTLPLITRAIGRAVVDSRQVERNRQILEMRILEGSSYREISQTCEIREDAARRLVSDYRPRIYSLLKAGGETGRTGEQYD